MFFVIIIGVTCAAVAQINIEPVTLEKTTPTKGGETDASSWRVEGASVNPSAILPNLTPTVRMAPTDAPTGVPMQNAPSDRVNVVPTAPLEIPVPPDIALPQSSRPLVVKEPLSWRAKALSMSIEYPFNEKNSFIWVLPIAYDKSRNLLKKAISQAGFEFIAEYPDAGEYLIATSQSETRSQVIIVSQPVGESKTLFKLRTYSGSKIQENKKIEILPALTRELFENRGLWQ